MSVNKFATINYNRKYTSLDVNTKTLTARLYENFSDTFPTLSLINFTDDFEDNGFDYDARGMYLDNFCRLDILFSGVRVAGTSGIGKIEFRANNIGDSINPTINTDYIVGNGKFLLDASEMFNVTDVETFYDGSYWKFRVTFKCSRQPGLSSLADNYGSISLFYNRV